MNEEEGQGRSPIRVRITLAHAPKLLPAVGELFREHVEWLSADLGLPNFETELATLPGPYAAPGGAVLLCHVDGDLVRGIDGVLVGCVAMRPLSDGCCEMKHLWLREPFRGCGLGKFLTQCILGQAKAAGYRCMRLSVLEQMNSALALCRRMGFREIPPYHTNPIPGIVYLEKVLGH